MTSETQTFIGLCDITAIRTECTSCKTQIIARLDTEAGREQALSLVSRFICPFCKADWTKDAQNGRIIVLQQFLAALSALQLGDEAGKAVISLAVASSGRNLTSEISSPVRP